MTPQVTGRFQTSLAFVLKHERGLVDDPDDPGGITNFGISLRFLKSEVNRYATDQDIIRLTPEAAEELYRIHFWERCRCGDMPAPLALVVFDCAVNQGCGAAAKLLQRSVGVTVDGVIGPITIQAVNDDLAWNGLVVDFAARRAKRYAATRGVEKYGRGWYTRLIEAVRLADKQVA